MNDAIETETTGTSDLSLGSSGQAATTPQPVSESSVERPVLAIGDLHGHLDRLEALLKQEGLLDRCESCDGTGERTHASGEWDEECMQCEGDGWSRTDKPATVVLLGDVGHFGAVGSPTGDLLTWLAAVRWADVILWGNHDRAVVSELHAFGGYMRPRPEVYNIIGRARHEGKLKLAYAAHGYLMTHAGLAKGFQTGDIPGILHNVKDPVQFADWINAFEDPANDTMDRYTIRCRDAISTKRGGNSTVGGILWRDIDEKLYDGFPQVFGHSADRKHQVRYCGSHGHTRDFAVAKASSLQERLSYCVDIGGKGDKPGDNCLAGVWLPSGEIVGIEEG